MKNEVGIGVVGVGCIPVHRGSRTVGVVKEDRDGIVPGAMGVVECGKDGVHEGVDDTVGSSERETGS